MSFNYQSLLSNASAYLGVAANYVQTRGIDILTTTAISMVVGAAAPMLGPVGALLAYEPARTLVVSLGKDTVFALKDLATDELTIEDIKNITYEDCFEYSTDKALEVLASMGIGKLTDLADKHLISNIISKISSNLDEHTNLIKDTLSDIYTNGGYEDLYREILSAKNIGSKLEGISILKDMMIENVYHSSDLFSGLAKQFAGTFAANITKDEVFGFLEDHIISHLDDLV